jgi:transposase
VQPAKRGDVPRLTGRTKGGLNSKLHAVCDGKGRPVRLLLTEGQPSDHKGAATLLADLPSATEMLGDKGYDSDAYRAALVKRGITPCIPPRAKRKVSVLTTITNHAAHRQQVGVHCQERCGARSILWTPRRPTLSQIDHRELATSKVFMPTFETSC